MFLMGGSCSSAKYFDIYNVFPRNHCILCYHCVIHYICIHILNKSKYLHLHDQYPKCSATILSRETCVSELWTYNVQSSFEHFTTSIQSPNMSSLWIFLYFTYYSSYLRTSDWAFRFVGIRHNECNTWHQFLKQYFFWNSMNLLFSALLFLLSWCVCT